MLCSLGVTKRSKFIDLRHYFIKDEVRRNDVAYKYVPTDKMRVDIFTKPLTRHKFTTNLDALLVQKCDGIVNAGVCEIYQRQSISS